MKRSPMETSVMLIWNNAFQLTFVPANLYCHETVPDPLQFSSNKFFNQSINVPVSLSICLSMMQYLPVYCYNVCIHSVLYTQSCINSVLYEYICIHSVLYTHICIHSVICTHICILSVLYAQNWILSVLYAYICIHSVLYAHIFIHSVLSAQNLPRIDHQSNMYNVAAVITNQINNSIQ